MPDEQLLELYRSSGQMEYYGELYNRYIPLLYGVCLKYLQDTDKAKDAVMQLFEDLLPKISTQEIGVFRSWIYTVVKNHCLQILRKEKKEILVDFTSDVMEYDEVFHLLCEEEDNESKLEIMKRCLQRLPEGQRVSIIHFFMDDYSYADIAEKTGYSLNTVKSNIQNGKRNLRICINRQSV